MPRAVDEIGGDREIARDELAAMLMDLLAKEKVISVEEAASHLRKSAEEVEECGRRNTPLVGFAGGSKRVLFCDEYFDLIAEKKTRSEIETRVARLGSKGRSSGIHLILTTQYPKADVVTGVLKANLSGRVCLRMTDARQSQVVLGQSGAEQLWGKGDLLFQDVGEPKRLQALFIPEAERLRLFRKNEY